MVARPALALALLLPVAGGCALAGRGLGRYVDDKLVKGAVKLRLAREAVGRAGSVKVDTFGGTVYLSGAVETAHQKSDAEIAAWRVEGVRQVVNDIVVAPAPAVGSASPGVAAPHPLSERLRGVARVDPGPPGGPDLAYDAGGRVLASIYTVGWRDLVNSGLATLPRTGRTIDHVATYALPARSDVPGPHYALVLWHVSEAEVAALR